MINNRQNGRRRGRGGNGGGGNNQRGGNPGRPDSGNRIDNRARGNANQLYEKYKNLARDAQMSGDRVNTEYYLQFADHYFRVLSETRARFEEQNPNAAPQRRIQPVDSFDDFDGDDEYGDEGEPIRAGEQEMRGQQGEGRGQQDRPSEQGQRGHGQREGGQRDGGQREGRDHRDNRDGARQGQPRYDSRRDEPRFDDGNRSEGNRGEPRRNGHAGDEGERAEHRPTDPRQVEQDRSSDRYAVTGSPIANDRGEDSPDGAEPSPVEPRRRGRPRRVAAEVADEAPAALDADRLPPSLSIVGESAGESEIPRPRRRRVRAAGEASTLG